MVDLIEDDKSSSHTAGNPYLDVSGDPKLRRSVVCYADILGFSNLTTQAIANGTANIFLTRIRNALTEAYARVREQAKSFLHKDSFCMKVFTDNIVIGYPFFDFEHEHGEIELGNTMKILSEFQTTLAMEGFLIRGGITCGEIYMDDDIVFGNGLLEAHSLDKSGGPPRIVMSASAIKLARIHFGFYADHTDTLQNNLIYKDSDCSYFVNYLDEAFKYFPDAGIFHEVLDKHRRTIESGLKIYAPFPQIQAKFQWAASYHNYVCGSFFNAYDELDDSDILDEEQYASRLDARSVSKHLINLDDFAVHPTRNDLTPLRR
ncbi:MAG: hypothetical protein KKF77_14715 [Proteobacteria bacterium]|nr:hypothetical protein [Pseudomonadota bacterium]